MGWQTKERRLSDTYLVKKGQDDDNDDDNDDDDYHYNFLTPVLNSQGIKKITICNTNAIQILLLLLLLLLSRH